MFQPNSGKGHLAATKKVRNVANKKAHVATYYVKKATPNTGYSSSSLKNSTEQLTHAEIYETGDHGSQELQTYGNQTSPRVIPKTQASGGGGKPPTNTGRGSFSSAANEPNPFVFLDSIATPRAPKWGGGPIKHNVSTSLTPSDDIALANLSQSLHKVNQRFSSGELKKVFSTIS